MSTFYYGPALDSELDHRRSTLLRDAATHRLARQARRAARPAVRTAIPRPAASAQTASPAAAPAPAEASVGPAGPAETPVAHAA
jgi:hypothetical protein